VVDHALLIDFEYPSRNDFLVVSQFTVAGTKKPRRPDLVCFVNGLPLGLIELKNPADQQANVWKAFDQLQTYQAEISDLLVFNQALVVSDGMNARVRLGVTATLAEASVHSISLHEGLENFCERPCPGADDAGNKEGRITIHRDHEWSMGIASCSAEDMAHRFSLSD
jgi:Type I restriction enzyme R protein N terminus (HSDR_N)